jgi:hypothetical protein
MMTNHVKDLIIEEYFLNPEILAQKEKNDLLAHMAVCALCAEKYDRIGNFYSMLDGEVRNSPTEKDKEFADRVAPKKRLFLPGRTKEMQGKNDYIVEAFSEIVKSYNRPLPQRVFDYVRFRPVRSAGMAMGLVAVLAGALFFFKPQVDKNVSYARAKDEFIVAYNQNGGELWRKHVGIGYDVKELAKNPNVVSPEQYLAACDVDGDGNNEVVAVFGFIVDSPLKNAIVCYNSDGRERWRYEFHRSMVFGSESVPDNYTIRMMTVGKFGSSGSVCVYAVAGHAIYYETDVVRLDAVNGTFISDYWHSGAISRMVVKDVTHDGREEIVLGAENNGYNLASLIVLNPDNMVGYAPAPASYTPQNVSVGTEEYYLLFPRNDLEKLTTHKRNSCTSIQTTPPDTSLVLFICETVGTMSYPIIYHFDHTMTCTLVEGEDDFVKFHNQQYKEGKLEQKLDGTYYRNLQQQVRYWDGEKFVNTPAKNKHIKPHEMS